MASNKNSKIGADILMDVFDLCAIRIDGMPLNPKKQMPEFDECAISMKDEDSHEVLILLCYDDCVQASAIIAPIHTISTEPLSTFQAFNIYIDEKCHHPKTRELNAIIINPLLNLIYVIEERRGIILFCKADSQALSL